MAPNMLLGMAFANSDDGPVFVGLYQVASKVLRHALDRFFANFPDHLADCVGRKVAHDDSMTIKFFFTVGKQPITNDRWNATLL